MSAEVELSKRGDDGPTTRLVAFVVTVAVLVTGAIAVQRPETTRIATALAPQTTSAADILRGQDLVYSCGTGGNRDLCLVPGDGGPMIQLTDTPTVSELWPAWSSDGTRLAFVRQATGAEMNIWQPTTGHLVVADVPPTADLAGGATITEHPSPIQGFMPAWRPSNPSSPNDRLSYSAHTNPGDVHNRSEIQLRLAVVFPDGGVRDAGRLDDTYGQHVDSTWRTDGTRVLATYRRGVPAESGAEPVSDLFSFAPIPGAGDRERLTKDSANSEGAIEADVSPDGQRMVVVECANVISLSGACAFGARRLTITDADGDPQGDLFDDGSGPRNPRWSPDGSLVAYSNADGIKVFDVGTRTNQLLPGAGVGDVTPAWRPQFNGTGVIPASSAGKRTLLFDEEDSIHAIVTPVPTAERLRFCLLPAVAPVPVPSAGTYCAPSAAAVSFGTARAPSKVGEVDLDAPDPIELVDVGTAAANRWQIGVDHLDQFGFVLKSEVSSALSVTCLTGTCGVFPYLSFAEKLRGVADDIDDLNNIFSLACLAMETVMLVASAYRVGFSGASLAGLAVSMAISYAIGQVIGGIIGNLTSTLISKTIGDVVEAVALVSPEQEAASAASDYQKSLEYSSTPPEVRQELIDAQRKAEAEADSIRARSRRATIAGLGCTAVQTGLSVLSAMLRATATVIETLAPVFTDRPAGSSRAIAASGATPSPAQLGAPAPRQVGPDDGYPDMPKDAFDAAQAIGTADVGIADTTAALQGFGESDEELATDAADLSAALGALAPALESLTSVSAFILSNADDANRAGDPILRPDELTGLVGLQERLADVGLYEFERDILLATGMTQLEVDDYVAGVISAEVPNGATTTTPVQLDGAVGAATAELASVLRDVAMDATQLSASVSGAPIVDDFSVITSIDTASTFVAPAFDRDGDELTITVTDPPEHGAVSELFGEFVYIPDPGYVGDDSFAWNASDAAATSRDAMVSIAVLQAPPEPEPDQFGMRQGTVLSVPAPGVLGNDVSPRIPLTATLTSPPPNATIALGSDGSFTFTPFADAVGPITFAYSAQFEGSAPSVPVTVTIDVVDAADPPAPQTDLITTPEGTPVVVAPLANDVDPDGDPVTLVGYEQGALGKVSCNLAASCTYTPTPDATGEDSWAYTVTDGTGRRSRGTVRVTITPVDEPPAPADDVLRFVKGVNGSLDLLANDIDPDGGALTFVGISDPPDSGTLLCDGVGVCTYTPANATVSGDEATYVVRDDDGVEASATVAIRAFAAFEEIESPGPILFIQGGSTLGCGAEYTGDDLGSFFAEFACGTFLASGGALYGPANIPGDGTNQPQPRTTFTPLRQSFVEGDGSPDDPFRITTTVAAGASGLELTQVDTYVTGATSYRTDLTVTNIGGGPANATLWRAGDCQRADSDTGFGRLDPTTGAVACVGADGRALEWFPLSAGSAAFEGDPIDMWEVIATRAAFPNTCRCADDIDNAAGLSWTVALAPGESTTRSHLTVFAPSGAAPISLGIAADESEVGPGASNGFTLTATNTDAISDSSLSQLRAVLPPGFSYVPGTTTGLGEPTVDGGVVQWNGPLVIGSSGSLVVHIGVIASDAAGIHTAKVDGTSADAAVAVGPGADVTVSEGALPPLPLFGATPTLLAVDFDAADSLDDGEIVAFAWAYGDGASGSGETSAHSYAAPGTYDVTLTVTDDDGYVRSTTKPVTVSDPNAGPTAIGTFMPARPVTAPAGAGPAFVAAALEPDFTGLSIVFDGTQSFDDDGSIIGWAWDFGDGSSGSGAVIEHEFPGPGHYIVRLTVTDDEGASATATIPVDVTVPPNVPPTADFEYVVDALSVDFDGTASVDPDAIDGQPVEWDWDFGDGTTGSGSQPTHAYATDGTYDVTLTVTDADGATDSITRTVGVGDEANEPPTAVIGTDVDGLTVDFEGIDSTDTDGTVEGYEWNFGDPDSTATGDTTSHIFPAPGTYTVFLMVTDDDGAVGTASMEVTVDEPEDTTTTSTSTSTSTTTTSSTTTTTTIDPDSTSSTTTSTSTSTTSTSSTTTSTSSTTTSTTSPTTTSTTSSTTSTTLAPTTSTSTTLAPTTSSSTTSTTATPSVVTFGPTTSVGEVGAPTSTPPPTISGGLPKTGSNSGRSLELVLLLLAAGLGLVLVSRRPKRS